MAGIPCGYPSCIPIPTATPGKFIPGTNIGYTWSKTFLTNNVPAINKNTVESTVPSVIGDPTERSTIPHASCFCEPLREVNPVYAEVELIPGAGVGLNRSKVVLCEASAENLGNITPEGCPIRDIEYLVHINRITENHVIDRSKNVKSKN